MPENANDNAVTTSRRGFLKAAATVGLAGGAVSTASQPVAAASRDSYQILEGTIYETTVYVYDSGAEGPTTFITGGIHGDERSGYMAAEEILNWTVDHGKLVVIPRSNVPAIKDDTRYGPNGDLNRKFPPRSGECYTETARAIWNEVVKHDPDWAFDLHSARGIWQSGDGSVGQALFPTWSSPAREYGENCIADLNAEFGLTGDMAYLMGNTLDADRDMLMHRIAGYLDIPGYICETTEKADSLEDQIQWHLFTVEHVMNQYGQSPNTGSSSSSSTTQEIHIEGTGPVVRFDFSVSGSVENAGTLEDTDTVYDSRVVGQVSSQDDRYAFTGDLEQFTVTEGSADDINVYLDGNQIDVSQYTGEREIHIEGTGPVTRFKFSVSGSVENAGTLEDTDTMYDSSVEGQVSSQDDRFAFTGELNEFVVTEGNKEDINVYVDGSQISVSEEQTEKVIHIGGTGPVTQFEFSVTGSVRNTGTLEDSDTMYDSRVEGQVSSQDDEFAYTGELEHFTVTDGSKEDVVVTVDGSEISVDDASHLIEIRGTGPVVQFDFTVSGGVENAGTLESTDTVYSDRVVGQVSSQDDAFQYTGKLESFTVTDGSADDIVVVVDGSEISVA